MRSRSRLVRAPKYSGRVRRARNRKGMRRSLAQERKGDELEEERGTRQAFLRELREDDWD